MEYCSNSFELGAVSIVGKVSCCKKGCFKRRECVERERERERNIGVRLSSCMLPYNSLIRPSVCHARL